MPVEKKGLRERTGVLERNPQSKLIVWSNPGGLRIERPGNKLVDKTVAGQNPGDAPKSPHDPSGAAAAEGTFILAAEDRPAAPVAKPSSEPGPSHDKAASEYGWSVPGYRVLARIGEGGMGAVYEADQMQPPRRVALKVVRQAASDDPYYKRLFEREVSILARLQHPGIAGIYDCGQTSSGQQFFTMELVRGVSLDEYARVYREGSDAAHWPEVALGLFLEVCEAVMYAHQQGIIHRDLKPANILVRGDVAGSGASTATRHYGRIAILDFGLARVATESHQTQLTAAGTVQGTLAYMSPEQVEGRADALDVRSDLYTLGVILFELLCGRLPYDLRGQTLAGAASRILKVQPTTTGLDGDLDTVLRKALEKAPKDRYGSVSEFAADLVRYRARQPIHARPPSTLYQIRKLVERHRAVAAALSLLLVTLVAGVLALLAINRQVRAERDRADREAATGQQTVAFLTKLFQVADPSESRGNTITVREILDRGSEEIESSLAGQPEIKARLDLTLGEVYRGLGLYDKAQKLTERSLFSRKALYGEKHLETARGLDRLGNLLRERGNLNAAKAPLEAALEIRRSMLASDDLDLASSLNHVGLYLSEAGKQRESEPLLRRALEIRTAKLGPEHEDRLVSLSNLVGMLRGAGRLEEAEKAARELVAIREKVHGPDHPVVARAYSRLASVLASMEQHAEAQRALRRVLAIQEKTLGESHPLTNQARSNLASELQDFGQYREAEQLYRQALANSNTSGDLGSVALSLNNLSSLLEDVGEYREARELLAKSLGIRRKLYAPDSAPVVRAELNLARLDLLRGELVLAENAVSGAMPRSGKIPGEGARAKMVLGQVRAKQGRVADAEKLLREAVAEARAQLRASDTRVPRAATILGQFLTESGRASEAEPILRDSHQAFLKRFGASNRMTAEAGLALASCLERLGKQSESKELRQQALNALQAIRKRS